MVRNVEELESYLASPSQALIADLRSCSGDILILGAGGKMGPSLAKLAKAAVDEGRLNKKVIAVSRFSTDGLRQELEQWGVETVAADLLDKDQVEALPDAANVIFMVGHKFGTTGREYFTWAMNTHVPSLVASRYRGSRIAVFSSGNVYPFVPVYSGGAVEETPPEPVGEYAQSCLGRERIFQYYSHQFGTEMVHLRLNYAIDLRYGVLVDLANQVKHGRPIDLSTGHVNCIWQGDANEYALRSLRLCLPQGGRVLNMTGPETVSIRWLGHVFAERFGTEPVFEGEESAHCLLNNAAKIHQELGYPKIPLGQMIDWTAQWIAQGGPLLGKPTHFQERKGQF